MSANSAPVQYYPLAHHAWPGELPISVYDESGQRLCVVPRAFLAGCATDPLAHLVRMVRMCVEEDGRLVTLDGVAIEDAAQLSEPRMIWRRVGKSLE